MNSGPLKTERLAARITVEEKQLYQYAARILGRTLSDFMADALYNAATQVIQKNNMIQLSVQEQQAFYDALLNPPEPSEPLIQAATRYATCTGSVKQASSYLQS